MLRHEKGQGAKKRGVDNKTFLFLFCRRRQRSAFCYEMAWMAPTISCCPAISQRMPCHARPGVAHAEMRNSYENLCANPTIKPAIVKVVPAEPLAGGKVRPGGVGGAGGHAGG